MGRILAEVLEPFRHQGRFYKPLILLFILINSLVFVNALLHDPRQGYDARDHIKYFKTLAEDRRIPTCEDSAQCYIPPLPYLLPTLLMTSGRFTLLQAAKTAQLANLLISLVLTYYVLKICRLLDPESRTLRVSALAMLGILPVYYKTLSLIRGETYLPLLIVFATYILLLIFVAGQTTASNVILLGVAMGLAILARQWAVLVLPAIFVFLGYIVIKDRSRLRVAAYVGAACIVFPLVLAGWYYGIMFQRYGTLTAWDRPASSLSLNVFPSEFYFGLGSGKLFTDPVRPSFANQFPAIFYSDTWGDYSAYFLVYIRNKATGEYLSGKDLERIIRTGVPIPDTLDTNRYTFNKYLGRVNLVSLIPTLIFIAGIFYALVSFWRSFPDHSIVPATAGSLLFLLIIVCSLAGYGWYLLRYQSHGQGGDLIKAAHMLQIFPFFSLLAGLALQRLHQWSAKRWLGAMIVLGLVFVHNLPAMITHYLAVP